VDDDEIRKDLEKIQPDPIDIKGTISPEEVTNVAEVPRGTCTGTLIPEGATTTGIICKKKTKEIVNVEKGKIYSFKTNEGGRYESNTRCQVSYKKMTGCGKLKLSCTEFSLAAGDSLRIKMGKEKETFKGTNLPNLEAKSKIMKVFFRSNKRKQGTGAVCSVSC